MFWRRREQMERWARSAPLAVSTQAPRDWPPSIVDDARRSIDETLDGLGLASMRISCCKPMTDAASIIRSGLDTFQETTALSCAKTYDVMFSCAVKRTRVVTLSARRSRIG
jgi:hypothetical protein